MTDEPRMVRTHPPMIPRMSSRPQIWTTALILLMYLVWTWASFRICDSRRWLACSVRWEKRLRQLPSASPGTRQGRAVPGSRGSEAGRTGTDLIQRLPGTVLFCGLTPPFDKKGFWVHNTVIVGAARQPALIWISDSMTRIRHGSAFWSPYTEPIQHRDQVDRLKSFGLRLVVRQAMDHLSLSGQGVEQR
jgi:hypothetical protein